MLLACERLDAAWRARFGMSANEELALVFLAEGGASPSELAGLIGLTSAGMTGLIDHLERDGFVRRRPHTTDGRRVLLTLTKRGFTARLELEQVTAEMASRIPEESLEAVVGFLDESSRVALEHAARGLEPQRGD